VTKKKRKRAKSTSSSSLDSSSQSEVTAEDSSSDSTSEDDRRKSRKGGEKKKKKKSQWEKDMHWELVNDMWDISERPERLRSRKVVEKLSLREISDYRDFYEKDAEKKGTGSAIFGRDQKPKKIKFKKAEDDGMKKLCEARFKLPQPFCQPKKYWQKMPTKRPLYRHFPLGHLGLEGQVEEKTKVCMHDRKVPVKLEMFSSTGVGRDQKQDKTEWQEPKEIKHFQEAVFNYTAVLWSLWPMDYVALVIQKVLIEVKWAEAVGNDDKTRIQLMTRFFNDVVRENSGRAVRGEPPATYDEAKARWNRIVEDTFPNLSLLAILGRGKNQLGQSGQGNNTRGGASSQPGGARGRSRGRGATGAGQVRQTAMHGGLPVCYAYNSPVGCQRQALRQNVCKDAAGTAYAHACNWLDRSTSKFCLQQHPRHNNH